MGENAKALQDVKILNYETYNMTMTNRAHE